MTIALLPVTNQAHSILPPMVTTYLHGTNYGLPRLFLNSNLPICLPFPLLQAPMHVNPTVIHFPTFPTPVLWLFLAELTMELNHPLREVVDCQMHQAITTQHILNPPTWNYTYPKIPAFRPSPMQFSVKNVGEHGAETGMTHFRSLVQCSNLTHPCLIHKLVIFFDFPMCHLPRIRIALRPMSFLVASSPNPWHVHHRNSSNLTLCTYHRCVKEVTPSPLQQINMNSKN